MTIAIQSVIAVSATEFRQFGCPHCGCQDGFTSFSIGGAAIWKSRSEDCGQICCILARGVTESPIGFGRDFCRPKLQPHPRRIRAGETRM